MLPRMIGSRKPDGGQDFAASLTGSANLTAASVERRPLVMQAVLQTPEGLAYCSPAFPRPCADHRQAPSIADEMGGDGGRVSERSRLASRAFRSLR
jgi:hypothetical protein